MSALDLLATRVESWTGIALERLGRREAVEGLLRERARALGLSSAEAYARALGGPGEREVIELVGLASIGCGWFFRDPGKLEVVERLLRRSPRRLLRVWVAGCGTGEEAWAVAMLARSAGRLAEVLATDLSEPALEQARTGRYAPWALRAFPGSVRGSLAVTADNRLQVVGPVRDTVRFETRSLVDAPPAPCSGGWDLIVCRGTLAYFRPARAMRTLQRMAEGLEPNGAIVLGERDLPGRAVPGLEVGSSHGLTVLHRVRSAGPARNVVVPPRRSRGSIFRTLSLGNERLRDGAPEEALALFDQAVQRAPLCAEAHLLSGMACHRLGDAAAAAQALRGALFLAPDLWPAAYYLALSYEELGESGAAQRAWEQVLLAGNRTARPTPLRGLLTDLESWKPDILELARRRTKRSARRTPARNLLAVTL